MKTTREQIVALLKEQLPYLSQEFGVKRIGLHGSFAHDRANEESDVDLIVEFSQPIGFRFIELIDYLEQQLGRSVDILTPAGIEGIRVNQVSQNIKTNIFAMNEQKSASE